MNTLSYKTESAKPADVKKEWVVVDAQGQALGRMSSIVAKLLRGKYKTNFTPHVDCGDNVIIINAKGIELSGNKWSEKTYVRHTGFPGGQRSLTAQELFDKSPARVVEKSVKGMLPKNRLGRDLFRNLKVFIDGEHNLQAQKPKAININELR